jgi:general secretion pathway protein L
LAQLNLDSEMDCAWLDRQGQVIRELRQTLSQLGQSPSSHRSALSAPGGQPAGEHRPAAIAGEQDRSGGAMRGAGLMLGDCNDMHIAHSSRDEAGQLSPGRRVSVCSIWGNC